LLSDLAIQPLALPSAYQSPFAPTADMVTVGLEPEHSRVARRVGVRCTYGDARRGCLGGFEFEGGGFRGESSDH
jgi:hypothetical protein